MTWEYDSPSASPKDEVRFLLGDTNDQDPQLQDEEIDYLVSKHGDATTAAIAGARALGSKYARLVTKSVGDLSIQYGQRSQNYMALADHLSGSGASTIVPVAAATGITIGDKQTAYQDTERVPSSFVIAQDDFPTVLEPPSDERIRTP